MGNMGSFKFKQDRKIPLIPKTKESVGFLVVLLTIAYKTYKNLGFFLDFIKIETLSLRIDCKTLKRCLARRKYTHFLSLRWINTNID